MYSNSLFHSHCLSYPSLPSHLSLFLSFLLYFLRLSFSFFFFLSYFRFPFLFLSFIFYLFLKKTFTFHFNSFFQFYLFVYIFICKGLRKNTSIAYTVKKTMELEIDFVSILTQFFPIFFTIFSYFLS